MPPIIIVFLKWPERGLVKTRLAASLGAEEATTIYRALVREVGRKLATCENEHLAICYAPGHQGGAIRDWIENDAFPNCTIQHWWPQPETDLGGRQTDAIQRAFAHGYDKAALIGTDCIDLDHTTFANAWQALDQGADWVFGPANDGGYYLGATKPDVTSPEHVFHGVRWSSEHTLPDCQRRIEQQGGHFLILETLADVDDYEDWQTVRDRLPL